MIESKGDASLKQFADTHLAPKYRESFDSEEKLMAHLREIREACAGFGGVLVDPVGSDGLLIKFMMEGSENAVMMRIDTAPPNQIVALDLQSRGARSKGPEVAPITWENLSQRLDEEAVQGFTGTVLMVHNGQIVLHNGYGFANREKKIANGEETIFAMGSSPTDLPRGGILKLEKKGKIKTSHPITHFLDHVPADKQAMTIDHLMNRGSGLPDFHHIAGVDADPDLSWIDRDTAVKRILGATL